MPTFYRPADGVAADFIPFYWNGHYHLFYLKDYRDVAGHGEGTPWWHLVSDDFVTFHDWGEALPRGPKDSQDLYVFTGSTIERTGLFHIFYTGHNHHFTNTEKPVQQVMHATSADLRVWTKDASFMFRAPAELYEKDDWRDPFVFWNAEANEYWMLLAARRKAVVPSRNRGCIALAASKDLHDWRVLEPFWAPDEYFTHECPDLFRISEWYYLVYSTFSERCVTHYRMSKSLAGPWLCPANDTFDGRAYYAAKTAGEDGNRYIGESEKHLKKILSMIEHSGSVLEFDEADAALGRRELNRAPAPRAKMQAACRRFVFGWLPTRNDQKDDGCWQWGGNLVAHEITQRTDGTLSVRAPSTLLQQFRHEIPLGIGSTLGNWSVKKVRKEAVTAPAVGRFSAATLAQMPDECLIETSIRFKRGTTNCGLLLRADEKLDSYYQVRLEPANQRMVIDRWPRPGDQPSMLERPLPLGAGKAVKLQAFVDGSCLVVYADDEVALSCRMYDHASGALGLFVTEGEASFANTTLKVKE